MSGRTLTITVPMPARECSPNGFTGRRAQIAAKMNARDGAQTQARQAIIRWQRTNGRWEPITGAVEVAALFVYAAGRRRDRDNAIASLKAVLDGFTRAGVWRDDSQVNWGAVNWLVDARRQPEVILTVKEGL